MLEVLRKMFDATELVAELTGKIKRSRERGRVVAELRNE